MQIERCALGDAKRCLHACGGGGKCQIRRGCGDDDEINIVRCAACRFERLARGDQCKIGGLFADGRDVTFADAGASYDPLITGVDLRREFIIGDHAFGQV